MFTTPRLALPRFHLRPLCYLFGVIPSFALAASTAAPQMEEVIVTAAKRNQTLSEYAGAVTVIGAEDLRFATNINDVARRVPGFTVLDAGPRNPNSLIVRGLRVDEVESNDLGGDGGIVASYIDNMPLQGYFLPPLISLKDLQNVEVLRGPQGTLYGNASIGGLVRYITAKPDLNKTALNAGINVSQTAESDDLNYDTDLIVNAPLIDETLGVRLVLGKTENAGFIDNPYLLGGAQEDINDDETEQARISALWQATEAFSLASSYHYQKTNVGDRQATNQNFTGRDYTATSSYRQPMEGELHLLSLEGTYEFSWASLTTSLSRYEYDVSKITDQTDYLIRSDYFFGQWYSSYDDFSSFSVNDVTADKDSVEVRLVSPDEQSFRWIVGAFYSADDAALEGTDYVPGFADFFEFNRPDDIDLYYTQAEDLRERSIYAEAAYDVTPQWEVMVGARNFHYEDEFTSCSVAPFFYGIEGTDLPVDCIDGDDTHSGSLGKFSTTYQFTPEQNIYLTIAEGYRRGGANALPATVAENRTYSPDTSINYEIGTHSYFLDKRLRVSASMFYIDWENIQVAGVIEQRYRGTVNAKDARSKGAELEVVADISNRWSVWTGISYAQAELTEDALNYNGTGDNVYAGDRLPGSPEQQMSLGVDYSRTLRSAQLDAGISVSRIDEVYTALNSGLVNYQRLEGYAIANADVSITRDQWRVGAFINNIGNVRGITGARDAYLYGAKGQFEYVTRPRTVGISLNYRY